MCKNGTNRENPVFYIGLSSDYMAFFASAINILQTLVVAIGAGLAVWGVINLLEGYGNDNRATLCVSFSLTNVSHGYHFRILPED